MEELVAALERIAKALETIAAAQRFAAEQVKKGVFDDEVAAERERNAQ